jgi:hypothetical protein
MKPILTILLFPFLLVYVVASMFINGLGGK